MTIQNEPAVFTNQASSSHMPVNSTMNNNHKKIGTLYIHTNDPKVTKKGVNVSNFKSSMGGYLPLLDDNNYKERKHDNLSYSYNTKTDHGARSMHKTTFNLAHKPEKNDYATKNKSVIALIVI